MNVMLRNIMDSIKSKVDMPVSLLSSFPELNISTESLDQLDLSPYQAEIKYNKLLPYANLLNEEADNWFAEIKTNLGKCVLNKDIYPGFHKWSSSLYTYIRLYGLRFTKDDHIVLVKLFYEMLIFSCQQSSIQLSSVQILLLLLKKKEVLSPTDLKLSWKPLYDSCLMICNQTSNPKTRYRYSRHLKIMMKEVVLMSKVYFPLSATEEILDEIRPQLFSDNTKLDKYLNLLQWFLPVNLPVEHHSISHELWFHEFMSYWETQLNGKISHDNKIMFIMTKLASNNIGSIDWNPYIPIMFTRFLYSMKMPVSYNKKQCKPVPEIDATLIAEWIASVLGDKTNAQLYLEKFLKTVETYCHPANTGRWSQNLQTLFNYLAYHVSLRLYRERYKSQTWEAPIPDSYKLTDANVDTFVSSMMPIAIITIFNRVAIGGKLEKFSAVSYLASMRPNMVIPRVLEKIYPILEEDNTERDKLSSVFTCILSVLRPLVQGHRYFNKKYAYIEGPSHVLDLLYAALSAINLNEHFNCFAALSFIKSCLLLVPIADSSNSKLEKREEDNLICEKTAHFEDFILQFMDKVFSLIKLGTHVSVRIDNNALSVKMDHIEALTQHALCDTFKVLVDRMSDSLFTIALNKLFSFIREETLEIKVAGQMIAMVCHIFSLKHSKLTLKTFVPYLTDKIFNYLNDHDITEDQSDNEILYPILILANIFKTQGNAVLPYIDNLMSIIDKTISLENLEINKVACSLLNHLLQSLCTIKLIGLENDSVNDLEYPHWQDWGASVDTETAKLKWYVPTVREFDEAQRIFRHYFVLAINKIQDYIYSTNSLSRNELHTSLRVIENCLNGCEVVLPLRNDQPILDKYNKNCGHKFIPTIGVNYEITLPNGNNVKHFLVQLMTNFEDVLLKNLEFDTESFELLLMIWQNLSGNKISLTRNVVAKRQFIRLWRISTKLEIIDDKGNTPTILQERVHLQHLLRRAAFIQPLTETNKNIILNLFKLSVHRYAEIREKAIDILEEFLDYMPGSLKILIPNIVETLQSDTEANEDAFLGVLTLLTKSSIVKLIKYDWQMVLQLMPALILTKPTENLETLKKLDHFVILLNSNWQTTNIILNIPENCIAAASELWRVSTQPSRQLDKSELDIAQELENENVQAYYNVLDKLIDAVFNGKLHWRNHGMATQFISIMVHPNHLLPTKVVQYFLSALIHDSIEERKLALKNVMKILYQLKRKHLKITISLSHQQKVLKPGIRSDNKWLLYDPSNWPTTTEKWNSLKYIHNPSIGFYAWPKNLEVYAPSTEQPSLDRTVRQMNELEKEVDAFFSNPENIARLVKLFSMEEKKGLDKFRDYHFLMFEGLFRNHGDDHLPHFLPYLRNLVTDSCESSQRCAAEIISGLIHGSKHWPYEKTKALWNHLIPIIKLILDNANMETINDWLTCFSRAVRNRDPNRMFWLFECLKESILKGDRGKSTINEQTRLQIFMEVIRNQNCRMSQWLSQLLPEFKSYLYENPLKGVRDDLAPILSKIYSANTFYNMKEEQQEDLKISTFINPEQQLLQNLLNEKSENGRKFLHTLCKVIMEWQDSYVFDNGSFYDLYPILVQMENSGTQYPELAETCSRQIAYFATSRFPKDIPIILETIDKGSESKSWSERVSTVEFLEVVMFYSMSLLLSNQNWINQVQSLVLKMLEDERIEVREKASEVLSGMLHCTLITDREALLEKFTKMTKKKRHSEAKKLTDSNLSETVRLRHIGILGMCAFIRAHPYDIPNDIPPIFEHLSLHLNEPEPILGTIRKTLSDFKRTHCDTSAGLQGLTQQLTPEQFEILQDLTVPPSYYS